MKIVVFTGAGVSKESGIDTFRDSGGTWENEDVNAVATPEGWKSNKEKVLNFYNERRTQLENVEPNEAHKIIADLEKEHDVTIITQNVDNLHERAGSTKVLHLHGELTKAQSTLDPSLVYNTGYKPTKIGDKCEKNSQLRPYVVWFGEYPHNVPRSIKAIQEADILLVIGTTLFIGYTISMLGSIRDLHNPNMGVYEVFCIDPNPPKGILDGKFNKRVVNDSGNFEYVGTTTYIEKPASEGMKDFIENYLPSLVES
jgi:NAD-dependent deacetylase